MHKAIEGQLVVTEYSLIQNLKKLPRPNSPYAIDEDGVFRVDATAVVPIELTFEGKKDQGLVGVDFVFLIDNSGSMRNTNDPGRIRFSAIRDLASDHKIARNEIDRVSIVVFSGDTDGSATEVWMDWSTWSETEVFIDQYLADSTVHPPAGGTYTPLAKGMDKANGQLATSTKPYKMVILLSDGIPEPEYYEQQEEIQSVHIPFAKAHHIIYSPILFGAGEEGASGLLDKIAIETDYITNPQTIPPYFSFKATNVSEIKTKYADAITGVSTRIVPKNVVLVEKVNDILEVVDVRLNIQESEYSQNQIATSTPLVQAINEFKSTGRFNIVFIELVGEVNLKFSVKLKLSQIPSTDIQRDYIEVDVNNLHESGITFDHPMYGTLPPITGDEWPQTKLRFLTGVRVYKELIEPPIGGDYSVKVTMGNVAMSTLNWFWLKESPSRHVDVSEITDDFGFSPFSIIVNNLMMLRTYIILKELYEDRLSSNLRQQLKQNVSDYFQNYVLKFANELDPYLCRYNIESAQKGIFKLVRNVPPLGERSLSFKVKGAAFGVPSWKSDPVDDPEKKPPITSRFRYTGVDGWKYLEPNPNFDQVVVQGPKPELEIDTCFDYLYLAMFFESLIGIEPLTYENQPPPNPYEMLDSPDITPTGLLKSNVNPGLSITVRNRGNAKGTAFLKARSIFIPLPDATKPRSEWIRPFQSRYMNPQIIVEPRADTNKPTETTFNINYNEIILEDRTKVPITSHLNKLKPFYGWVISTVDIGPASGELLLSNNSAIEIIYFYPPRPTATSLLDKIIEKIKLFFGWVPEWPP